MKRANSATLAARILSTLAGRNLDNLDAGRAVPGEMELGKLRRVMNAYRHPDWEYALGLCRMYGGISIDPAGTVKLLVVPGRFFPTPPRKHRSAGRHRSERDLEARRAWVEQKRRERGEIPDEEDDDPLDDMRPDIRAYFEGLKCPRPE